MNTGENPPPSEKPAKNQPETLNSADRFAISEARRFGPELRRSRSERDRFAGWLLKDLADLAERLTKELAQAREGGEPRA